MMDDFDTAYANARDKRAFSNGTDWEIWSYNWCENNCVHDAAYQREETNEGCPLALVAMCGRTPREWLPGDPKDTECGSQYTCVYYRHEGDDDPDMKPAPDPPGMEALFPLELVEPGRVFIPMPEVPERVR